MLKQFSVPVPKSVSGENIFIYPLNVSPLDNHRIKTPANGSSSSTYWKSPYYGPESKHLDIQFKNTELYNATIGKQLEAKEKSVKSILKNSLPPSSLEQCVPERARKPDGCKAEVGKPKYNLRQALSPSESRSNSKKEKRVKFDDRYGRLSAIESKYRLSHSEKKDNNAKVRSEKTNSVKESLFSLQADRNLEQTEQEHDLAHAVTDSDRSSVIPPQETDGGLQNTNFLIHGDKQSEQRSEHESNVPDVIVERLNSVDISNDDEGESDIQKNSNEKKLKLEETTEDFSERIPLYTENLCGVNVGIPIDTSGVHVSNKSQCINVLAQDSSGKRAKTLVKSKTAPDLLTTRYAHNYDLRGRRGSLDDSHSFSKIALGRRRISGKTTVNTLGGAVVTRSHVRPVMFSRLSRESSHVPLSIESRQQSYRNFCDKNKTSQIVDWLEHVKEIQSREGPCIQADSDIDKDK